MVLVILFIVISLMNLWVVSYSSSRVFSQTGRIISTGAIALTIITQLAFDINNPLNGSMHNFNMTDGNVVGGISEFPIKLNVTTSSDVTNWSYFVYNADYGDYRVDEYYIPNLTIYFRAGWNNLTVSAKDVAFGAALNKSVLFYVNVSNSDPIINLDEGQIIYACEGEIFEYPFNVTDYDDELDTSSIAMDPNIPPNTRLLLRSLAKLFESKFPFQFYTSPFSFENYDVGSYSKNISVSDGVGIDSKMITVQVLHINNEPDAPVIGPQLIYRRGNGTTFNYEWVVEDIEDGFSSDGLLDFNLSYSDNSDFNLFDISEFGIMNFTADNNTLVGTYDLKVCVSDNALTSSHDNLSTSCVNDGSVNSVCRNFFFTVNDTNRAPEIIDYLPNESSFATTMGAGINFSVDVYEPDSNPVGVYWYMDGVLIRYNVFNSSINYNDNFLYSFPCGVYGNHIMLVNVSDGEFSDNFSWTINVAGVPCDTPSDGGGGGGGGGASVWCYENWFCEKWNECLSAQAGFDNGLISLDDFYDDIDKCRQLGLDDAICGFQIRNCVDLMNCSNDIFRVSRPEREQICHFVENPSCFDGVKNCHDGDCELLVDCGGPCKLCATCSDGIKNHNEEGIDCGGPCPYYCEVEEPGFVISYVLIGLSLLILVIIMIVMYFIYRFILLFFGKKRKEDKEGKEEKGFKLSNYQRKNKIKNLLKSVKKEDE